MDTDSKQIVQELAESKGLAAASVRCGNRHVFFIKRGGRVLNDHAFDFEEAVTYLNNYVGESRRAHEMNGDER